MSAQPNQAAASSSNAASGSNEASGEKKPLEQLGALEEDDEFEEFPAEDWPESSTTLAALTAQAKQNGATGANGQDPDPSLQLWEDNWDDDDKEPTFTNQLRAELKKQSDDSNAMKM